MDDFRTYYDALKKPSWTPETGTIGTIWTLLYPIIFIICFFVVSKVAQKEASPWLLLPFGFNLFFNFSFTPLQMVLRNQGLAAICAWAIFATIIWCMIAAWPVARWMSIALVPYLLWVGIASVLQTNIWYLNK